MTLPTVELAVPQPLSSKVQSRMRLGIWLASMFQKLLAASTVKFCVPACPPLK